MVSHPSLATELVAGVANTLRGFRNGSFYGTKIRLPHALVMTFLFRRGSLRSKIDSIMKLTLEHTRNLAAFVLVYKATLAAGRVAWRAAGLPYDHRLGHPAVGWHAFVAGCVGGYLVWSKRTPVNNQIVMYLIARILFAAAKALSERGVAPFSKASEAQTFPWLATLVWGCILYLFEQHRQHVHGSLRGSMSFLYHDANAWTSVSDFLPSVATAAVLLYNATLAEA